MSNIKHVIKGNYDTEDVHSIEGISTCLRSYGGGTSGSSKLIMDNRTTVAYSKSTREKHIDIRGKVDGEANTISTGDGGGNMSTQNFVADSYNRKDGIVKELDTSHTLSSSDYRGLNRNQDQNAVFEYQNLKIRKLTPVECERLQGYPDNWTKFARRSEGTIYEMSNTQRYRQCGNGISSPVSSTILQHLIPEGEVKLMSLFSGIGGTELLLPERFKVVGHCEFDKYASDVLRYHYPDIPNFGDVTKLADLPNVPAFDLLTFGHPCQSFSAAGLRKGLEDHRGQLIYEVFRIIETFKPKYILGENVKGLLTHDKGNTFEQIMVALSQLGYEVDFELVNSKHFGLAQNRERVFYFGRLK